ncbi:MAG: hypothetical protein K6B46_05295 [Opitutales bacterium]|nr:hypothetical protein [Opitutales bacterium]
MVEKSKAFNIDLFWNFITFRGNAFHVPAFLFVSPALFFTRAGTPITSFSFP